MVSNSTYQHIQKKTWLKKKKWNKMKNNVKLNIKKKKKPENWMSRSIEIYTFFVSFILPQHVIGYRIDFFKVLSYVAFTIKKALVHKAVKIVCLHTDGPGTDGRCASISMVRVKCLSLPTCVSIDGNEMDGTWFPAGDILRLTHNQFTPA